MHERVMLVLQDSQKKLINQYRRKMTNLTEVLIAVLILLFSLSVLAKIKVSGIEILIFLNFLGL